MQRTETPQINLLDFQKIGKGKDGEPGKPYDILDDKIAEYITQKQLKMFVLNGIPYLYRRGVYRKDEDGRILKAHIKALIWPELITINRINRVYNLILSDYRLSKNNEDVNQYPKRWVNFINGMFDPMTGELHEHRQEYYAINQIPHTYDPNAVYRGKVTEKFFKGLFPDDADREMFFAFAGYCMTVDVSLQKFMVIVGAPGSGKSTAINMLVDAVGRENVSSITLQNLGERFMPTELLGKLLNACADLPKKALEQVDAIKRITGEDLILGEYKGGKIFTFYSYAKLLYSANEMPINLDEKSEAFYRRLLAIEVKQKGPQIPNLREELEKGMPGFIHECMAALSRMYAGAGEIDSPNSRQIVREFHRESDSVQSFLDDCIEMKPGERIERGQLYRYYETYCQDNDWTALNNRSFYRNLRGKGYVDYQASNRGRYFRDLYYVATHYSTFTPHNGDPTTHSTTHFEPATPEENAIFAGKTG